MRVIGQRRGFFSNDTERRRCDLDDLDPVKVRAAAMDTLSSPHPHLQRVVLRWLGRVEQRPAIGWYLTRVARTPWYQALNVPDRARALDVVAQLALRTTRAFVPEHKELLRNTLEHLATGAIPLTFESLGGPLGAARTHVTLTQQLVYPEGQLQDLDAKELKRFSCLAVDIVAHEVSHVLNEDRVENGPVAEFLFEYRAWFIGRYADLGRYPTRREAYAHVALLLGERAAEVVAYPRIAAAWQDQNSQLQDAAAAIFPEYGSGRVQRPTADAPWPREYDGRPVDLTNAGPRRFAMP